MPIGATEYAKFEDASGVLSELRSRFAPGSGGNRDLLAAAGAYAKARAQETFRKQEGPGGAWKERSVPNIAGIITDLTEGTSIPSRRFESRPALIDKHELEKSVDFQIVSPNSVEVGSNRPYAAIHQLGGKSETLPITKSVQERLWAWMKGSGPATAARKLRKAAEKNPNRTFYGNAPSKTSVADIRHSLGWMLNKKFTGARLTLNIPAREFLGLTQAQRIELGEDLGKRIVVGVATKTRVTVT